MHVSISCRYITYNLHYFLNIIVKTRTKRANNQNRQTVIIK